MDYTRGKDLPAIGAEISILASGGKKRGSRVTEA